MSDPGEVLAAKHYAITLSTMQTALHDAVTADGRQVQIKATMKEHLNFPWGDAPDYYIGLKIPEDGTPLEVYNGPEALIKEKVPAGRKSRPKTGSHVVSLSALSKLRRSDPVTEQIPLAAGAAATERPDGRVLTFRQE